MRKQWVYSWPHCRLPFRLPSRTLLTPGPREPTNFPSSASTTARLAWGVDYVGEFRGIMGVVEEHRVGSSERKGRCYRQLDPKPRRSASLGLVDCITSLYNLQNGATSAVTVKHKVTTLPCVVQQLCCRAGPCGCEAALVMPRLGRCCMPHSGGRWHWSEAIGDGGALYRYSTLDRVGIEVCRRGVVR